MAARPPRALVLLAALLLAALLWHASPSSNPPASLALPLPPPAPVAPQAAVPPPPPPPKLALAFQSSFRPSTHALDLQGYNVFTSLYLHKGQLVYAPTAHDQAQSSSKTRVKLVDRADVLSALSDDVGQRRWAQVDDGKAWFASAKQKGGEGVRVLDGTTVRPRLSLFALCSLPEGPCSPLFRLASPRPRSCSTMSPAQEGS